MAQELLSAVYAQKFSEFGQEDADRLVVFRYGSPRRCSGRSVRVARIAAGLAEHTPTVVVHSFCEEEQMKTYLRGGDEAFLVPVPESGEVKIINVGKLIEEGCDPDARKLIIVDDIHKMTRAGFRRLHELYKNGSIIVGVSDEDPDWIKSKIMSPKD